MVRSAFSSLLRSKCRRSTRQRQEFLGTPRIEPRATGREARTLPLKEDFYCFWVRFNRQSEESSPRWLQWMGSAKRHLCAMSPPFNDPLMKVTTRHFHKSCACFAIVSRMVHWCKRAFRVSTLYSNMSRRALIVLLSCAARSSYLGR